MKRFLCCMICFLLLVSNCDTMAIAQETETVNSVQSEELYVNPVYEDSIDEEVLQEELDVARTYGTSYDAAPSCSTIESAADILKEGMVAREDNIAVTVTNEVAANDSYWQLILNKAMDYSDASTGQEADALRYVLKGASVSIKNMKTAYQITYTISYYTTAEQEKELTEAVNAAISSMNLKDKTEVEKVSAIHNYICENVEYDYEHLGDNSYDLQYTAYAALINKTAVCQGYAVLFYRMCKEAGLSVRIIPGNTSSGSHAWNIVRIGKVYYNIDTTWDDAGENARDYYYLKSEIDFPDHYRDEEYTTSEFTTQFPMAETSYGAETPEKKNFENPCDDEFASIDGDKVSTKAEKKAKALIFFGAGCANSKYTIQEINNSKRKYSDVDIVALEANSNGLDSVKEFAAANGTEKMKYGYAADYSISSDLWTYAHLFSDKNNLTFPFVVFIDSENRVQGCTVGKISDEQFNYYLGVYMDMSEEIQIPLEGISLNKTSLNLNKDVSETLSVSYNPADTTDNKDVVWTSSNSEVASVDQTGKVTAKKEGTAEIKASVGDKSAVCKVTVQLPSLSVSYTTHVQDYGWQNYVSDGTTSGTTGKSKRLEAIKIKLGDSPYEGGVQYSSHVQDYGWQASASNDAVSGTSGKSKRLEAIQINLTGEIAEYYDIYYRVHAQNFGWMGWTKNGANAGTAGYAYRLEAIQIKIVKKGEAAPSASDCNYEAAYAHPLINYRTHVQDYGWQGFVKDGATSGTSGQSKRLEAIEIKLNNQEYRGDIQYKTHIQDYGWEKSWTSNGKMSGTSGQAKRLEAIQIQLTGEMAEHYDVYYRVHAQNFGWMDWAKNGASAGTAGYAYRLEAIQIVLVPKGGKAPGSTNKSFVQK